MATIFKFPTNDERKWAGIYEGLTPLLIYLGATLAEIDQLQPCIQERWEALGKPFDATIEHQMAYQERWEALGKPFDVQLSHQIPGPLTEEQHEAFLNALRAQATEIAQHFKIMHSATLLEFVKLEFEIVRLKRVE